MNPTFIKFSELPSCIFIIRGNASLYSGKHLIVKTIVGINSVDARGVYSAGSDVLAAQSISNR
jgi:hypothetical protein